MLRTKPKAQSGDERVEKTLLPAAFTTRTGVIFKAMISQREISMGILLRETIHIHKEKHAKGGHISEHAQFNVIVQEGW